MGSTVDLVLLVILAFGAIRGFLNGFVMQVTSLAALLLGIWIAVRFSDLTAVLLVEKVKLSGQYIPILAFAITFILVVVGVHFAGKMIDKVFNLTPLGIVNKLLGLLFGFFKYAIILSVLIVFIEKANDRFNFYTQEAKNKTILYKPLSRLAPAIYPYLHFDSLKEKFKST
ncbi:MAG: rane protein required for colicin production [Tenuifilum sp.]|jgi:membrane protein required for colicin V production|uniref:CvpA family protein n=1 Tax=Tenuifilum thalassicum TaxID=2590900 RepID=A0A7D3XFG4_9BACT|nr:MULTISPECIES: CvpA family protein [Tenuifilum]MDI3527030.1 rane protein required for colicin production [Tenuifilum sp.]QKG81032.1 CvpA family protein [Tenuifilum thalassicum]